MLHSDGSMLPAEKLTFPNIAIFISDAKCTAPQAGSTATSSNPTSNPVTSALVHTNKSAQMPSHEVNRYSSNGKQLHGRIFGKPKNIQLKASRFLAGVMCKNCRDGKRCSSYRHCTKEVFNEKIIELEESDTLLNISRKFHERVYGGPIGGLFLSRDDLCDLYLSEDGEVVYICFGLELYSAKIIDGELMTKNLDLGLIPEIEKKGLIKVSFDRVD